MHFPLLTTLLLASCANYDFAKARLPNGEPDLPKLIADLKESGKDQLIHCTWIPLLYLDLTTFKASNHQYPDGYTFTEATSVAPIFCGGTAKRTVVDAKGAGIENEGWFWLGWGLLFHAVDERIETPSGPRLHEKWRLALLFHDDDVLYARPRQ